MNIMDYEVHETIHEYNNKIFYTCFGFVLSKLQYFKFIKPDMFYCDNVISDDSIIAHESMKKHYITNSNYLCSKWIKILFNNYFMDNYDRCEKKFGILLSKFNQNLYDKFKLDIIKNKILEERVKDYENGLFIIKNKRILKNVSNKILSFF